MKLYLSGSINGAYRAQNIIKVLGDSNIPYFYMPFLFHKINFKIKLLSKVLALLALILSIPARVLMIILSTHVFVLPMNTSVISIVEIFFAKLFRKKIVVDYYISMYDTLVNDRKRVKENSSKAKVTLTKDRLLLNLADIVIFLNKSESQYYQKIAGLTLNQGKVRIIPLCIDYKRDLFDSKSESDDMGFNVCWWGTYIPLHGLENIIKSFSFIGHDNIKLFIFGNSEEKSRPYQELVNDLGLNKRVKIINDHSFSNGKLAPFLKSKCDLALGNFGSSEKAKTVLVNKLVDSLSLGLPCLTRETSAINELFNKDEGLIITEADPESIAENIVSAYRNKEELQKISELGKRKYLDVFSPDAFKVKLIDLFDEIRK